MNAPVDSVADQVERPAVSVGVVSEAAGPAATGSGAVASVAGAFAGGAAADVKCSARRAKRHGHIEISQSGHGSGIAAELTAIRLRRQGWREKQ
jgi:hypothetical protein